MTITATYSPDDNKIRLSSAFRLDKETYARVKAAGFSWAPRQEQFIAPMWTPEREDLALELSGQDALEDEDTTLLDRAEDRAERFEGYSERREADAERAHEAAHSIAKDIPFGQPILVGHHSEARARKDAERIETGFAKAAKAWETAVYWERRAQAAIAHAKYKELPAVRHRRIKAIESDRRKQQKNVEEAGRQLALWQKPGLTQEEAATIANYDHLTVRLSGEQFGTSLWSLLVPRAEGEAPRWTAEKAAEVAIASKRRILERCTRWLVHFENRLAYERAMLAESTGAESLAAKFLDLAVGCRVKVRHWSVEVAAWYLVSKVNKDATGETGSVTIMPGRRVVPIESVLECMAADPSEVQAVKAANKLPPLVNYKGEGFVEMTAAEYKRKSQGDMAHTKVVKATDAHGAHRQRHACLPGSGWKMAPVFLTDDKVKERPAADAPKPDLQAIAPIPTGEPVKVPRKYEPNPLEAKAKAAAEVAKAGVQVVSAPQLFPTPPELADRLVEALEVQEGMSVLEPSAGTGRLIEALRRSCRGYAITAVEINGPLSDRLRTGLQVDDCHRADFLEWSGGLFDRIVMNPPFRNGEDIKHVKHALTMLKPGGRLVALCANGPRQREALESLGVYEPLPAGSFSSEGTEVNVALITIDKEG